jgi:biopolymer transport protein ExbD
MAGSQPRRGQIISGINVTPLVDITLVLLVIFMVTANLEVTPAVPLDLPAASQSEEVQTIFSVLIPADGPMRVDGEPVDMDELAQKARAAIKADPDLRAVIQADGAVPHRKVMSVLDALKTEGLARVAFAVVPEESE